MAQTNFTPILTYKSDTATSVPSAGNLTNSTNGAELAVNTADKRLFTKDSGGNVVEVGTNPSSLTLPNSTANGVLYSNGSKVVTSGSALTFNGTQLGINISPTQALDVSADASAIAAFRSIGSSGNDKRLLITSGGDNIRLDSANQTGGAASMAFSVGSSEGMRLTSTGLGIGTSSPAVKLDIEGTGTQSIFIERTDATTAGVFQFNAGNTSNTFGSSTAKPLVFLMNSSEVARFDTSGNLGLGVTPSASTLPTIQSTYGVLSGNTNVSILRNAYYNSGWKYTATGAATFYQHDGGSHIWYNAPSGTAGNAITFTQAMTLDASGNLGVGATSLGTIRLNVRGDASTNTAGIKISHPSNASNGFELGYLSSVSSNDVSIYNWENGFMRFATNGTERARIDSSGNLLVGNTGPANGRIDVTSNSGGTAINVRARSGNDYGFIQFKSNDDATVWGEVYGTSSIRLYCDAGGTNGVYLTSGATSWTANSDERLKENLVPIENGLSKVCSLRSVIGNFISDETKTKKPFLIAQDVQAVLPEAVSLGAIPKSEDTTEYLGVAYTEVIPLLVAAIKEQQAIIELLKARLDAANL